MACSLSFSLAYQSMTLFKDVTRPAAQIVPYPLAAVTRRAQPELSRAGPRTPPERKHMPDIIYSFLIVAFFLIAWVFTRACEKL